MLLLVSGGFFMHYFILIFSIIVSFESWARCSERSADSLLSEIIHNCKSPTREARIFSVGMISGAGRRNVGNAVLNACMDGGCSFIVGANRERCKREYAKAFRNNLETLVNYAKNSYDCEVDKDKLGSYLNASSASNSDTDLSSCFWTNHSVIRPGNRSCGRTPACVGGGYCDNALYQGSAIRGNVNLQCEAVGGRCPSFSDCANADDPGWVAIGSSERYDIPINRPAGARGGRR